MRFILVAQGVEAVDSQERFESQRAILAAQGEPSAVSPHLRTGWLCTCVRMCLPRFIVGTSRPAYTRLSGAWYTNRSLQEHSPSQALRLAPTWLGWGLLTAG